MEPAADTVIRAATRDDAAGVAAVYAPYVTDTSISFEEVAPSAQEMAERIGRATTWLVAEREGEVLGYAYAAPFHPRPAYRISHEVSIYLRGDATGRGLGQHLLDRVLEELRDLGVVNALAGIAIPNPASEALFRSRGFEQAAHYRAIGEKHGQRLDVIWLQLAL